MTVAPTPRLSSGGHASYLRLGREHKRWTEDESIFLCDVWPNIRLAMQRLSRSYDSVRLRGNRLGLYVPRPKKYTPEMTEQIIALWRWQKSATHIGRLFGKTRSAILGKLFRLGLLGTRPRARMSDETRRQRRRETVRKYRTKRRINGDGPLGRSSQRSVPTITTALPSLSLSIIEVKQGQCRYIAGEDHLCCGQPAWNGTAYCGPHWLLCHERHMARGLA